MTTIHQFLAEEWSAICQPQSHISQNQHAPLSKKNVRRSLFQILHPYQGWLVKITPFTEAVFDQDQNQALKFATLSQTKKVAKVLSRKYNLQFTIHRVF